MSFLPALATWQFALAGAIFAAGPVILHILNRRRYRVVEWGAMQFLREAMQRSRKVMQLRDLLLMLLRAAAVLLFGLALARPFFAARHQLLDVGQPVFAVLLIDNSLSMGYQTLEGTVLERAKARATAFVERLPAGSRITVYPLAGSEHATSLEPFDSKPSALEALQRIETVDRSVDVRRAINDSRRAAELVTDLAPRYVFFSDQRRANWSDLGLDAPDPDLPALQLVDCSDPSWDNTWIAEVRVPDGIADAETPTIIEVELRHHGAEPRRDVRVGLWVRDQEVDSEVVSFETADATQAIAFEYTFRDAQPSSSLPDYVPVKVTLAPDRLVADDERHLLVPVVAVVPVVFVDQYGTEEDPARNQFGETRHLRQLLAPGGHRSVESRQLIQIRHVQLDELDREMLADTRLVVVAGVSDPSSRAELLREYVEQGGQLLIAAGAGFDPVAWNASAWDEGRGVLPLPVLPDLLGNLPNSPAPLQPMSLSYESLGQHPYFQLAGNAEDDLRDLYAEPFFFQAVKVDEPPEAFEAAMKSGAADADQSRWLLWSAPQDTASDPLRSSATKTEDGKNASADASNEPSPAVQPDRKWKPRVLARLVHDRGAPLFVERAIGSGRTVFFSSGVLSDWNTLPKTNAVVIFDRVLRSMLQATLPVRNFGPIPRIALPLPDEARESRIVVARPGDSSNEQPLDSGFLGTDQVGVAVERPLQRGVYRVRAVPRNVDERAASGPPGWSVQVAVNGDEAESDLEPYSYDTFAASSAAEHLRWVGRGEEADIAGARIRGQNLWWWLTLAVLLLLLLEWLILLWPAWAARRANAARPATIGMGA